MAAIARELALRGVTVLFGWVQTVVERLLNAKRNLELQRELEHLDRYHCLCLDDIGYVQQDEREMEVLFELLVPSYRTEQARREEPEQETEKRPTPPAERRSFNCPQGVRTVAVAVICSTSPRGYF